MNYDWCDFIIIITIISNLGLLNNNTLLHHNPLPSSGEEKHLPYLM